MKKPTSTTTKTTTTTNYDTNTNKSNLKNTSTTNNSKTNKKETDKKVEKKVLEETPLQLVIDSEDKYLDNPESVIYFNKKRILQVNNLRDRTFDSVLIKNSSVEDVSSLALKYIIKTMKVDAKLTVIIGNPLTVMQPYDAKQVEANAVLAGFTEIEIIDYEDDSDKNSFKTKAVIAIKPEKNPNVTETEIELKSTTTTSTVTKGGKETSDTKTNVTAKLK